MISSGILDGSTPNFSKILTAFPLSCIVQKTAFHRPKNCHRLYLLQTRPLWGEPTRCEQYQWCSRSASWLLPPKQAGLFHEQAWSNTGFGSPWNQWPRHTIAQYTLCGWGERDLHWDHASTTANHLFHRLAGFLLMTLLFYALFNLFSHRWCSQLSGPWASHWTFSAPFLRPHWCRLQLQPATSQCQHSCGPNAWTPAIRPKCI